MDPELVKKLLGIVESQDEKAALGLLTEILASLAGAPPSAEPPADPLAAGAEPKPEEQAALAVLKKLTGKESIGEAVAEYAAMSARIGKIEADSRVLEDSSRRELVGKLVKLGAELPATAWEPLAADADPKAPRTPVKRLRSEPIEDLRSRVEALSKGKPVVEPIQPPAPGDDEPVALSKTELAYCAKHGLTPAQFQAKKAGSVKKASK